MKDIGLWIIVLALCIPGCYYYGLKFWNWWWREQGIKQGRFRKKVELHISKQKNHVGPNPPEPEDESGYVKPWVIGRNCPSCQSDRVTPSSALGEYICESCGYRFGCEQLCGRG